MFVARNVQNEAITAKSIFPDVVAIKGTLVVARIRFDFILLLSLSDKSSTEPPPPSHPHPQPLLHTVASTSIGMVAAQPNETKRRPGSWNGEESCAGDSARFGSVASEELVETLPFVVAISVYSRQ